jgi:hypothetical protein
MRAPPTAANTHLEPASRVGTAPLFDCVEELVPDVFAPLTEPVPPTVGFSEDVSDGIVVFEPDAEVLDPDFVAIVAFPALHD